MDVKILKTSVYNLDAIIAVSECVNCYRATQWIMV
jgi:hypothetical protein